MFAVFGSAGDIFPSIAVAKQAQRLGHRVTILAPRSVALYARTAGVPSAVIGDGSELHALSDGDLYTCRFDGFSSWRRTADRYGQPLLASCYDKTVELFRTLKPDLVVVHPLAPYGSLAAEEVEVPWVSLHLYPQLVPRHTGRSAKNRSMFGGTLPHTIRAVERERGLAESRSPLTDRGWSPLANFSVHDPAFLRRANIGHLEVGEAHGFPYWDAIPVVPAERERLERLSLNGQTTAVVTLGSFIGQTQPTFWREIAAAIAELRWRGCFVGPPAELRPELEAAGDITCLGFVRMSEALSIADVVMHHGGIGTTYASLLAGVPAAVVPQAFDQQFNARLLETAGVGSRIELTSRLTQSFSALAGDTEVRDRCRELRSELVAPDDAAEILATRLLGEAMAHTNARPPKI